MYNIPSAMAILCGSIGLYILVFFMVDQFARYTERRHNRRYKSYPKPDSKKQ